MNAQTTSLGIALANAVAKSAALNGVPVRTMSQTQIVWTWIKDHPHCTIKETAAATRIPEYRVNCVVWDLHSERGMLTRRRGSRYGKGVWEYAAIGKTYELLPKKLNAADGKSAPSPVAEHDEQHGTDAAQHKHLGTATAQPKFDIEAYTLGELRSIYAELKALFG